MPLSSRSRVVSRSDTTKPVHPNLFSQKVHQKTSDGFSHHPIPERPYGIGRAQSAVEYLLLIAGAILVVTVVLVLLFTNIIPIGGEILQNNITQSGEGISTAGYKCGNGVLDSGEVCEVGFACVNGGVCQSNCTCGSPPPTYGGPIFVEWDTISHADYSYFEIDSSGALVNSSAKRVSGFKIRNAGASPVVIEKLSAFYSFSSSHPSLYFPLPSSLSTLTFQDSVSSTIVLSLSNVPSGSILTLPTPITLNAGEEWTGSLVFDQPIFPISQFDSGNGTFYYFPAEGAHSMRLQFTDDGGTVHRPSSLDGFLSYEKKNLLGGLDPFIQVCDGALGPSAGGIFGVITDWCVIDPLNPLGTCDYIRDIGYSTAFAFPSPISSFATLIHSQLFMTQDNVSEYGDGTYEDADPYYFLKGAISCSPGIYDTGVDSGSPVGASVSTLPVDDDEVFPEVKYFDVEGLISPGENEVFVSIAGEDAPDSSYTQNSEGWRFWRSGYYAGTTPPPFLMVRYSVPV